MTEWKLILEPFFLVDYYLLSPFSKGKGLFFPFFPLPHTESVKSAFCVPFSSFVSVFWCETYYYCWLKEESKPNNSLGIQYFSWVYWKESKAWRRTVVTFQNRHKTFQGYYFLAITLWFLSYKKLFFSFYWAATASFWTTYTLLKVQGPYYFQGFCFFPTTLKVSTSTKNWVDF